MIDFCSTSDIQSYRTSPLASIPVVSSIDFIGRNNILLLTGVAHVADLASTFLKTKVYTLILVLYIQTVFLIWLNVCGNTVVVQRSCFDFQRNDEQISSYNFRFHRWARPDPLWRNTGLSNPRFRKCTMSPLVFQKHKAYDTKCDIYSILQKQLFVNKHKAEEKHSPKNVRNTRRIPLGWSMAWETANQLPKGARRHLPTN